MKSPVFAGVALIAVVGISACVTARHGAGLPLLGTPLMAQDIAAGVLPTGVVYQCPMDPDVRQNTPGKCPKCGMELKAGIPEPVEFPMDFSISPRPPKVGATEQLTFAIHDPENDKLVEHFQIVHEMLFHMFAVSGDLNFFVHDHPEFGKDGKFRYNIKFPRPGLYRILGDFYPDGATPQLNAKTVIVPGGTMETPHITKDYSEQKMENMSVSITTEPPQPIAGMETRVFIHLNDADGMEKLLGAWAHMLAASDDLIDLMHSHPYTADGGPEMRFDVYFPRAHGYRVWFQFQKKGIVNTAHFDIPVTELN